jgi:Na+/pantothenate symporter
MAVIIGTVLIDLFMVVALAVGAFGIWVMIREKLPDSDLGARVRQHLSPQFLRHSYRGLV